MLRSSGATRSKGQPVECASSTASSSTFAASTPLTAAIVNSSGPYPSRSRWPSTSSAIVWSVTSV